MLKRNIKLEKRKEKGKAESNSLRAQKYMNQAYHQSFDKTLFLLLIFNKICITCYITK